MAKKKPEKQLAAKAKAAREVTRALGPFEEMERLFEGFFPRAGMRPPWGWRDVWAPLEGRFPKVDVIDREDEVLVRAEIPGVRKEDLEVSMTDNTVSIKGSTSHEEKEEKGDFFRREISRGSFTRSVGLPSDVDGAKANASFKDGVLELVIPKLGEAKRHSIKVE